MAKAAIISVDGHVKPPREQYRDYVDPAFREALEHSITAAQGSPDGFVHPALDESAQWDPSRRLADLETQAVVAEVLFTNGLPFAEPTIDHAPDPTLTRASNMAYNRWLADFCSGAPGRLCGLAAVSFDDVAQAVRDIAWAKDQGFVGVLMPPLHPGARYFFDPALDPIWAACVETGLPLAQHGGTGAPEYQPVSFSSFMVLATEHWFFSGRSLWQLMLGGVFDRFPELKLVLVETESWWIRPMIELLDRRETMGDDWSEFAETLQRMKPYSRLPSEYWASNCYAGLSPMATSQFSLDDLGDLGGPRFGIRAANAMVGVDYPHPETVFPRTLAEVKVLVDHPAISGVDARKVLYENAASVFHLDLGTLQTHIDRCGFELDEIPVPAKQPAGQSIFEVAPTFVELVGSPSHEVK